jgi:hypothetical protein
MTRSRKAVTLALIAAFAACKDAASPAGDTARLRIVNSVFQGPAVTTATPVAVDVLVDSSISGAGVSGLTAPSLSAGAASGQGAGDHAGAAALFTAAGYRDLPTGVHSFVGRVTGTTTSFFRTADGEYLPKQYLLPFPYTFILAGVVPDTTPADPGAVPWAMIVDDPFAPPTDSARVQLINAAPMADTTGGGQGSDITATLDDGAGGVFSATASYRHTSGYVNPAPGTYTLTLASGSFVLYTGTVTLAKGEVRTFIVQSTAYAAVPGPGNTKVTNLRDNQW